MARKLFKKLSFRGRIHQKLTQRNCAALFARFTDIFGANRMINCSF